VIGQLLFNGWEVLARTLVVGVLAYVALVFLLIVSGKRTLSKMNAFDLVVTVALGSTLASTLISSNVALAQGVLAFGVLIGLQFAITWLSVRSPAISRLVRAEPTMLFYEGRYLRDAMRRARVAEAEILQAMREQDIATPNEVEAVILETNGEFSVVKRAKTAQQSTLADVQNYESRHEDRAA
jgi:uncharacterized membrane protein YcaP (DUF421 family)